MADINEYDVGGEMIESPLYIFAEGISFDWYFGGGYRAVPIA